RARAATGGIVPGSRKRHVRGLSTTPDPTGGSGARLGVSGALVRDQYPRPDEVGPGESLPQPAPRTHEREPVEILLLPGILESVERVVAPGAIVARHHREVEHPV